LATERSSSPRIVSRAGAAQVPANGVLATDEMLEARATIGMFSVELMAIPAEAARSLDRDPARFRSFYDEVITVIDDQESVPSLATRVRQDVPKTCPQTTALRGADRAAASIRFVQANPRWLCGIRQWLIPSLQRRCSAVSVMATEKPSFLQRLRSSK
jgi:hypothetical protein